MRISIVLGTRPEIIKLSPIIRECNLNDLDYYIVHTGQHYSYNMDEVFFNQLELTNPQYNLEIGSGSHAQQTGKMLMKIEEILLQENADMVLVQGDTNSVLAGAIAATKLGIDVSHVEAGLRSYDRTMPEEINRILADHCSNFLFAPTMNSKKILLQEGISESKIFLTGNTIVDALKKHIMLAKKRKDILRKMDLEPKRYFLVTLHRQENVDNYIRFKNILEGLKRVQDFCKIPIVYPIHPRAKKQLSLMKLSIDGITTFEPLDYLHFLQLEKSAKLILTDSGGVQEEACILGIPCVTLRDNTERPETIEIGANRLVGTNPDEILKSVRFMMRDKVKWKNPFGDGKSGTRIVKILSEQYE